jgi:hypothetical protein
VGVRPDTAERGGIAIWVSGSRVAVGVAGISLGGRDELDVVVGPDSGADDDVTQPFRLAELLARVRSRVRRTEPAGDLSVQDVRIDVAARRTVVGGRDVEATSNELDLLVLLAANAGQVVTRRRIMREVCASRCDGRWCSCRPWSLVPVTVIVPCGANPRCAPTGMPTPSASPSPAATTPPERGRRPCSNAPSRATALSPSSPPGRHHDGPPPT